MPPFRHAPSLSAAQAYHARARTRGQAQGTVTENPVNEQKQMLDAPGVGDMVDLKMIPYGNAHTTDAKDASIVYNTTQVRLARADVCVKGLTEACWRLGLYCSWMRRALLQLPRGALLQLHAPVRC